MSNKKRTKQDRKQQLIKTVSLVLAGIMVFSVAMAAVLGSIW